MKLIIAGRRDCPGAYQHIQRGFGRFSHLDRARVILHGARGDVDWAADSWARRDGLDTRRFPADWDTYGNRAGPIRNSEMARHGDALLAIWDGASPGTRDMITKAVRRGLPCYVEPIFQRGSDHGRAINFFWDGRSTSMLNTIARRVRNGGPVIVVHEDRAP